MIFHRTIENTDTHFKTLWSEESRTRFFVVSATEDSAIGINETMAFSSDSEGQIISWRDLAITHPASRDPARHETLASQAYVEYQRMISEDEKDSKDQRDLRESMGMGLFNHAYALGNIKENN